LNDPSWVDENWTEGPVTTETIFPPPPYDGLEHATTYQCQYRYKREKGFQVPRIPPLGKLGDPMSIQATVTFSEQKTYPFTALTSVGTARIKWTCGGHADGLFGVARKFESHQQ
jgi:hypothetical protein